MINRNRRVRLFRVLSAAALLSLGGVAASPSGLPAACAHDAGEGTPGAEAPGPSAAHPAGAEGRDHSPAERLDGSGAVPDSEHTVPCDCGAPCCPSHAERPQGAAATTSPVETSATLPPPPSDGRPSAAAIPHLLPFALGPPAAPRR